MGSMLVNHSSIRPSFSREVGIDFVMTRERTGKEELVSSLIQESKGPCMLRKHQNQKGTLLYSIYLLGLLNFTDALSPTLL